MHIFLIICGVVCILAGILGFVVCEITRAMNFDGNHQLTFEMVKGLIMFSILPIVLGALILYKEFHSK
jgi:hypothetical protein